MKVKELFYPSKKNFHPRVMASWGKLVFRNVTSIYEAVLTTVGHFWVALTHTLSDFKNFLHKYSLPGYLSYPCVPANSATLWHGLVCCCCCCCYLALGEVEEQQHQQCCSSVCPRNIHLSEKMKCHFPRRKERKERKKEETFYWIKKWCISK